MVGVRRRSKKRSYHHGDLERALVDASIALIAEKGIDALTMREVARRVGVTHAAAYRHFADKGAVLEAIAARGYRELAERLRRAIAKVPASKPERRLARIAIAYVAFALEQEARFRVMTRPRREQQGSAQLEAAIDDAFGVLLGTAEEGIARGRLRPEPAVDHARRVYVFAYGYASLVLKGRVRVRPELALSDFEKLLAPVVAAPTGGRRANRA